LHQVLFANFFAAVGKHTNLPIEESTLRHMVLNTLRAINVKFRNKYGRMVIASDSPNNWRKEYFLYYKAARKKTREASDIDWKAIFLCIDNIKTDLQEHFPYKFIQIDGAEADDIIAVITEAETDEQVLIVSGDKDFRQLQAHPNVVQYDPIQKKWLHELEPAQYLFDHILSGDTSDGIPNILSEDNTLVLDFRQNKLTKGRRENLVGIGDRKNDKYYRNWIRNKTLIDFHMIPETIKEPILQEYYQPPVVQDRSLILPYLIKHKMTNLIEHISEF
jgi:5'-3' exonuclease